ncbi:3-oxoacyl-ACP reductase [Rheinheimera sp.]|jgi:3-oxoacyl-[acyl-carrier protein] reductase|uniref:3-oxoacyl-ACP reductase n=1 Tax=Rheinheimera sp. TaxID=1869214 RepID=UPI00260FAB51|nr:3-oxoacyl-ACP reductase [Rheinheimera sp.]MCA1931065.1 3-oxoacyl-ACP reductase [Rheinheimera sp.]
MTSLVNTFLTSKVAAWCGIPQATPLLRPAGETQSISGHVLICGKASEHSELLRQHLQTLAGLVLDNSSANPLQAILFDGIGLQTTAELDLILEQVQPALRRLAKNGRVLVLARAIEDVANAETAAATAALSGFVRSLAKELGIFGTTANLLVVHQGVQQSLIPAVEFFLSKASAYVSGQVVPVRHAKLSGICDWIQPLSGKIALVTGASRGIGAAVAATLSRQGATVVGVDVAQTEQQLAALMAGLKGKSLALDISQHNSADVLSDWLTEQGIILDILVHNAGITRDKLFYKMSGQHWQQTLDVNLRAVQRIDQRLMQSNQIQPQGRVVLLSSMNGLAGQKGQTNYASSKAALVGYCQFMAKQHKNGITFNAVAPGFIETQMTAVMPMLPREIGRRLNSLHQAGLPEDVAQAVAFFARPDAAGLNGVVLRVCGQCFIGA